VGIRHPGLGGLMTMGQLDQHLSLEGDIIGMEIRNVGLKGRPQDLHGNAGHVNETIVSIVFVNGGSAICPHWYMHSRHCVHCVC